jgi:hypothetical protein
MTITKLKTVGSWQTARWLDGGGSEPRGQLRGRVITGLLTSDAPDPPVDPTAGKR